MRNRENAPAMTLQDGLSVSAGLLTPVIALIAAYIARQQWKTNHRKLLLDLYDRRLRVYEEVRTIIGLVIRDASLDVQALLKFRTSVFQADFLFRGEIVEYIDEVFAHGNSLSRWVSEYRDYTQEMPVGYDHKKVVDNMHVELEWFTKQPDVAKHKFSKYLSLPFVG